MSQPPQDPFGQQDRRREGQHAHDEGSEHGDYSGESEQSGYDLPAHYLIEDGDPYVQGYSPPAVQTGSRVLQPSLRLDDGLDRTFSLRRGRNVVGRAQDAEFRLLDGEVSLRHLEITWDGRTAMLSDLRSTNGTTVNGIPVQTWELADGDVIRVGRSSLVFRAFSGAEPGPKVPLAVSRGPRGSTAEPTVRFGFGHVVDAPLDSAVTVYTSSDDGEPLQEAVVGLLELCGFEVVAYGRPVTGSWFRRLFVRSQDSKAADKLADLAGKLERAAELKYINAPRSESDEREATAIARLAHAMESMDEVVIRTSSVLFIKTGGRVLAWVLSETEIGILDRHPELMRSPTDILDTLPRLRQEMFSNTNQVKLSPLNSIDETQ